MMVWRWNGLGLLAVMASTTWAQNSQNDAESPKEKPRQEQRSDEANSDRQQKQSQTKAPTLVYLSELTDIDLINEAGEEIGDIEDCILTSDGMIHYVIIETDDRTVAVPPKAIQVKVRLDGESRQVVAVLREMSAEDLRQAPSLEDENYRELSDKDWRKRNAEHYQQEASLLKGKADLLRASMLLGAYVYNNADNTQLADVDYLVADMDQGTVRYALIDHETTLTDDELVAVPFRSLTWMIPTDGSKLFAKLDSTKPDLDQAPRVAINNLMQFSDKEWVSKVDRTFAPASDSDAN